MEATSPNRSRHKLPVRSCPIASINDFLLSEKAVSPLARRHLTRPFDIEGQRGGWLCPRHGDSGANLAAFRTLLNDAKAVVTSLAIPISSGGNYVQRDASRSQYPSPPWANTRLR